MKNADMSVKHEPLPARDVDSYIPTTSGLTKREHFAAMAMQGLCAHSGDYLEPKHLVMDAVAFADALLKELEI